MEERHCKAKADRRDNDPLKNRPKKTLRCERKYGTLKLYFYLTWEVYL